MAQSKLFSGLTSIVAIDQNGAIGCRNSLPWSLKSDMAFFRRQTLGNTVIMGRKTYDSIGKRLPGRKNVVLSHNNVLFPASPDCQLALSVPEAIFQASRFKTESTYVIGGAVTYSQFDNLVDRYLVTVVDHVAAEADAYIGRHIIAQLKGWDRQLLEQHSASTDQDQYGFAIYEIIPPDADERRRRQASVIEEYKSRFERASRRRNGSNFGASGNQVAFVGF